MRSVRYKKKDIWILIVAHDQSAPEHGIHMIERMSCLGIAVAVGIDDVKLVRAAVLFAQKKWYLNKTPRKRNLVFHQ